MTTRPLHISLLGPLHVRIGAETAVFRTDALRALLAYLAAHQGSPQRRDTLAGLLSPDRPDKEALTYLRNRLTRLRAAIRDDTAVPPYLDADRKQISLRAGADVVVDLVQFEQRLAAAAAHAHRQLAGCPDCLARLDEAAALVRGELLAGLNFPSEPWQAWLLAQREHVQQRALAVLTQLRDARLARGEWTAVLALAQRQLSLEPWLEAAHRASMIAHAQLGDRSAALAQYALCAQCLRDELGIDPEPETTTLYKQIKANTAPTPTPHPSSLNLHPSHPTPFFGREAEQAMLRQRLVDPAHRLLTLTGTGGIGKTRLALEVGRQVRFSFPDGVWFVPLDAVRGDAEQMQIAIGEALGLGQEGRPLNGAQVLALLRERQLLLILDNCEAALDGLGFIPDWLRRAPRIALLATSRAPLNFQAEAVVALDGLPGGAAAAGAAEALFAAHARLARADFALTADNLPRVRQICELVDGSPLGIALAAAWVRRRSLAQIQAEIGRSLDFLSTRLRDVDPRHRSVRAVFETSWQLLDAVAQAVLAALAVFPTSFTAAAAAEVAAAALPDLDLLCEKSLLQQQHEPERYALHSLLRQFAAEKLAARTPEVEHAFVAYFVQFARAHRDDYAALQPEWGNLLTAVRTAHARQLWPQTLELAQALDEAWFRQIRFGDMRAGLALAVEAAEARQDDEAQARLLLRLGEVETELNDYAAAEAHLAAARRRLLRLEDGRGLAQAAYLDGRIRGEQARDAEALRRLAEAKSLFAAEADWPGVARTLNLIALSHMKQNPDFEAAHAHLAESVAIQRRLPPAAPYAEALRYLGRVKGIFGDYAAAEACLVEAAQVSQALRDVGEYAAVLFDRIVLCRRQQQLDAALRFGAECLALFQELGSLRWEGLVKTQLAILHQAQGHFQEALPLFENALRIYTELGDVYEQAYAHYYLFRLHAAMGDAAQSQLARQQALHLNATLADPQLKTWLE